MTPSAYLVTGAGGMLGSALVATLEERGARYTACTHADLDITVDAAVDAAVSRFAEGAPGRAAIVNAAAYTDVEGAEDDSRAAYAINESGAGNLAAAAARHGLGLAHVSTDFIFDGEKTGPYVESDEPRPLSVYGASKLVGEHAVTRECPDALIVRTAWVFGDGGTNFPDTMIRLARERDTLAVVTDQFGSPTYTHDLAAGILALLDRGATGVFNLAGAGSCSRFELARATLDIAGLAVELEPTTADAFPTRAARPRNSALDCSKAEALGVSMPAWEDALARFVAAGAPGSGR